MAQKLAQDSKRTSTLAKTLPRGVCIGKFKDKRPKPFFVRYGSPRRTESFASEYERNDRAVVLRREIEDSPVAVERFDPAEWEEF